MENPFAKLVSESIESPIQEDSKEQKLEAVLKRLDDLRVWQNDWTVDDRRLAESLESQIRELENEIATK